MVHWTIKKTIYVACLILVVAIVGVVLTYTPPFGVDPSGFGHIPDHARLKVPLDKIIGNVERNGVVKYAYKTFEIPFAENEISGTKHTRTFKIGERVEGDELIVTYQLVSYSGVPQFYTDGNGKRWQADYATTTKDYFKQQGGKPIASNFFIQTALAESSSTTFFPDPDPETNSFDGYCRQSGEPETWAFKISAATADDCIDNSTVLYILKIEGSGASEYKNLFRAVLSFFTAPIPDGATITSTTLSVFPTTQQDTLVITPNLAIVGVTTASTTGMVVADYGIQNWATSTEFTDSRVAYADLDTGSYEVITLNSAGNSYINKTGLTKFGLINGQYDLDETDPGVGGTNAQSRVIIKGAEEPGTSQDPRLIVTYELAGERRLIIGKLWN